MNLSIGKFIATMFMLMIITCSVNAQTKVGDNKEGGIVYWVDSTGMHGLIADVADLGEFNWANAIDACQNKGAGWRLPSKDELDKLYRNKDAVGGFLHTFVYYWSSGDYNAHYAWSQYFKNGDQNYNFKTLPYYVRAVRSF